MCYRPLFVKNHSAYIDVNTSVYGYSVPCGHCLACQQAKRDEWQTRISFEISSLYKRGGVAVFLTFTYNDANLPHYTLKLKRPQLVVAPTTLFGDKDLVSPLHREYDYLDVPCFNHEHVTKFLNNIKVNSYKLYGRKSYKYFFVCEYGSDTKRPHYHCIFFLEPRVDVITFVELCRKLWKYGFMFPKYDVHCHQYVDNHNKVVAPTLRSLKGGARYVSKYITKDISYFEIPFVKEYLLDPVNKLAMKRYLPKHWQSNGLGYSVYDTINLHDDASVKDLFVKGVFNPLTAQNVPLPRYLQNRLLYKNVRSNRLGKNGRPLYDRELSSFGFYYMYEKFLANINAIKDKYLSIYQAHSDVFQNNLQFSSKDIHDIVIYSIVWRSAPYQAFRFLLSAECGDFSQLFNTDLAYTFWINNKDTYYLKHHVSNKQQLIKRDFDVQLLKEYSSGIPFFHPLVYMKKFFERYEDVLSLFEYYSFNNMRETSRKRQHKLDECTRYKRKYCTKYPVSLC